MLQIVFRLVCTTLVCSVAAAHAAQTANDPSDPAAPVPVPDRSPVLHNYRPYAEGARPSWPALMQEVAPEDTARSVETEPRESPAEPRHDHSHHQ